MRFYKREPKAALDGMADLSLEERGAYTTLLDWMYLEEEPIADRERMIAGYLNCDIRVWRRIRASLIAKGKLVEDDGFLVNPKAAKVIAAVHDTSDVRRTSGLAGGYQSGKSRQKPNENSENDEAKSKQTIDSDSDSAKHPYSESLPLRARERAKGAAQAIFDELPPLGKKRTGGDARRIREALEARMLTGDSLERLFNSAMAFAKDTFHQRDGGAHGAQIHKLIEVGFLIPWMISEKTLPVPKTVAGQKLAWCLDGPVERPRPAPALSTVTIEGHAFVIPAGKAGLNAVQAEGMIRQQIRWCREWLDEYHGEPGHWPSFERGEPPGQPLCKIWPSVLERLGLPPTPAYESDAA